ncbi:aldehyde dehydrogenase family protein [Marinobacterium rhizophilum]|uniref:Aldehyde dehydrogenase family protein n=1 Tax=Marinobacterium rhizophilum TaxID=420402 RepID=A0ABY5HKZ0_9GAMM|nr:aldehyde dehydrogenase family protein [Marinobacterium rhizophilum]UTW12970.1 aldehyde dehydrogenase family protein [Marinobacterium rhizophilum]
METLNDLYIGGHWVPAGGAPRQLINPADGSVHACVRDANAEDVDLAVRAARRAFAAWSATPSAERAACIERICDGLQARSEELAATISREMGMPLHLARGWQVAGPITGMRSFVARTALMDEVRHEGHSLILREAIGVCAFITPWNVPLHQLVGKVAPALAAGCTMVLKPAEATPLHARIFAEVAHAAGLPAGVFNLVTGDGPGVGEPLCTHPQVDMVSFTGSTRAGVRIAQMAAPDIKRVCQELGGKSPLIITEDADLAAAIRFGVRDLMVNSGQICCSLSRMLVPRSRYAEAVELARREVEAIRVGHPESDESFMGPMSSAAHQARVLEAIRQGLAQGARLVCGGTQPPQGLEQGCYVRPTLLADVTNDMGVARDEIFGPVLCMLAFEGIEDAIEQANDTPYGLAAAVWAADMDQAQGIARRLRAGQVSINGAGWNYCAPFGGYKQSGNGREWSDEGLSEFVEIKSIQLPE